MVIVFFLAVYFYTSYSLREKEGELVNLQLSISKASSSMLSMRRTEQHFIATRNTQSQELLNENYLALAEQLKQIDRQIKDSKLDVSFSFETTSTLLEQYHQAFTLLALELTAIHGSEGRPGLIEKLKVATMTLEEIVLNANNDELDRLAIQTQDLAYQFFTRYEQATLDNIVTVLFEIQSEIETNSRTLSTTSSFHIFKRHFWNLQRTLKSIGYTSDTGLKGELTQSIYAAEDQLSLLFIETPAVINENLKQFELFRHIATAALGLVTLLVLFYITVRSSKLEEQLIVTKENEKQANRAKSAFLANMSHEIRTPLNGVIGMSEILAETKLTVDQQDSLNTINTSSQALLMLINDILDLSKIESGRLEINPHTTDVRELIYDTTTLISSKAFQKQLKLEVKFGENIPDWIYIDGNKVRQVLMNFASNAMKFTEQGEVKFSVDTVSINDDTYRLRFSVSDTGVGIASDQHEHIFEAFCQETSSMSSNETGTGLGLSISSRIVELMGGNIQLESKKGIGSCFSFELEAPLAKHALQKQNEVQVLYISDSPSELLIGELLRNQCNVVLKLAEDVGEKFDSQAFIFVDSVLIADKIYAQCQSSHIILIVDNLTPKPADVKSIAGYVTLPLLGSRLISVIKSVQSIEKPVVKPSLQAALLEDMKVLVVEDNRVNQKVVCVNLDKMGVGYLVANDGQEAIDLYKQHYQCITLVLMDCMMPNVDGFQATELIRAFESKEQLTPCHIIALTASVLDDDVKRCFECGMDDYLPKPFKREMLLTKVGAQHVPENLTSTH
ncbi:ATP-binding protein [Vibrio sp. FNV 38]|nr:ATP-binding protein [Vibrio sp. FNV 38]